MQEDCGGASIYLKTKESCKECGWGSICEHKDKEYLQVAAGLPVKSTEE
jgi:hypothetical protein